MEAGRGQNPETTSFIWIVVALDSGPFVVCSFFYEQYVSCNTLNIVHEALQEIASKVRK